MTKNTDDLLYALNEVVCAWMLYQEDRRPEMRNEFLHTFDKYFERFKEVLRLTLRANPEAELAAEKRAREHQTPVLQKAQAIVEERGKTYGTPINDFTRLAKLWSAILGTEVTPEQTVRCMIAVKLSRLSETPGHEDSILDIAGYAWVLDEVRKHAAKGD